MSVANTILQGIVGNCTKIVKAKKRLYWNFIKITFAASIKKHDEMYKEWDHCYNIDLTCTIRDKWMTSFLLCLIVMPF